MNKTFTALYSMKNHWRAAGSIVDSVQLSLIHFMTLYVKWQKILLCTAKESKSNLCQIFPYGKEKKSLILFWFLSTFIQRNKDIHYVQDACVQFPAYVKRSPYITRTIFL